MPRQKRDPNHGEHWREPQSALSESGASTLKGEHSAGSQLPRELTGRAPLPDNNTQAVCIPTRNEARAGRNTQPEMLLIKIMLSSCHFNDNNGTNNSK